MATRNTDSGRPASDGQLELSQFFPPLSTGMVACPFCGAQPARSVMDHAMNTHPDRINSGLERRLEELEDRRADLERFRAEIEAHEYDFRRNDTDASSRESQTAPGPLTDTEYDPGAVDGRHCAGCGEHVSRQYVRVNGENDNETLPHCANCKPRSERY